MSRCESCPVPGGLRCYEDEAYCRRAARPGEGGFRAILVRHAEARAVQHAAKPRIPLGVKLGSAECIPCQQAKEAAIAPPSGPPEPARTAD